MSGVSIGAPPAGDTFERREDVEVTVTFSAAVAVTGTPRLALTIGTATRQANYATGSGSTELLFRYRVVQADADADGISIGASALALNGGTIVVNGGSTNAALGLGTHAISNSANHKVMGSRVTIAALNGVSITSTPAATSDTYGWGERMELTVTFVRPVTVVRGTPQLTLYDDGSAAPWRRADYATGSGSKALVFHYTVQEADSVTNGVGILASSLQLNGGFISDARDAATAVSLTLSATIVSTANASAANHKVDGSLGAPDPAGPTGRPEPAGAPPGQVTGVRVRPLDRALHVAWSPVPDPHGSLSQYRVDVRDGAGGLRRVYTEADVHEATVDRLDNGVEYTVTVSALPGHGGENGPPSEPAAATPRAGAEEPPGQVTGVRVRSLDRALHVAWSPVPDPSGSLSQYRVDVRDGAGGQRQVHTEADVHAATVDRLDNGVEYTVTVSAVPGHGGENGPPSEPAAATPRAGAEEPVPALPLAATAALAGLLAAAAHRRRARRPASTAPAARQG